MTNAYACDLMYMCVNFEDIIFFLGGENVKPRKNSIFMKNGKTIFSAKVQVEKLENFLDLR